MDVPAIDTATLLVGLGFSSAAISKSAANVALVVPKVSPSFYPLSTLHDTLVFELSYLRYDRVLRFDSVSL